MNQPGEKTEQENTFEAFRKSNTTTSSEIFMRNPLHCSKIFCLGSTKACQLQKYAGNEDAALISQLLTRLSIYVYTLYFKQIFFLSNITFYVPCEFVVCRTCNPRPINKG